MDIHHATGRKYSLLYLDNYDYRNGVGLALPEYQHFILSKYRKKNFSSLDEFIEEELCSLKNYTDIPTEALNKLRNKIVNRYIIKNDG